MSVSELVLSEWLRSLKRRRAILFEKQIAAGPTALATDSCSVFDTGLPRRPEDARLDAELEDDIGRSGQRIPIIARPHPVTAGAFEIVDGARRVQAFIALNRRAQPSLLVAANVLNLTDQEAFVLKYSRQVDRADLSVLDRARALAEANARYFKHDTISLAQRLNVDVIEMKRLIGLGRLPPEIFAALVRTDELTIELIEPLIVRMRALARRTLILGRALQIADDQQERLSSGRQLLSTSAVIDDLCEAASTVRVTRDRLEVRTRKGELVARVEMEADGRGIVHILASGSVPQSERYEALHRAIDLMRDGEVWRRGSR